MAYSRATAESLGKSGLILAHVHQITPFVFFPVFQSTSGQVLKRPFYLIASMQRDSKRTHSIRGADAVYPIGINPRQYTFRSPIRESSLCQGIKANGLRYRFLQGWLTLEAVCITSSLPENIASSMRHD
jgi:hypothetical protein